MTRRDPALFTIPASAPFLRTLAHGLLERYPADSEDFRRMVILLPTRRAVRELEKLFMAMNGRAAMILPRILPFEGGGDDGDESLPDLPDIAGDAPPLLPPISRLRRHVLLSRLVTQFQPHLIATDGTPPDPALATAQAWALAGELARLLDEAQREEVDLAHLPRLVDRELAHHWEKTSRFLGLLVTHWPAMLAEEQKSDIAAYQTARRDALTQRIATHAPTFPLIAAGSTGSVPATARLLKAILHAPHGMVVLPDLDLSMEEEAWDTLEPVHAQFTLKQLLTRLDQPRAAVRPWPMQTTPASLSPIAPHHITFVEAGTARDEATAIALLLRETMETPDQRALCITPDRALAARVRAELRRWDIAVDDSSGTPLAHTPLGALFNQLAQWAAAPYRRTEFYAWIKHPLCRFSGADALQRMEYHDRALFDDDTTNTRDLDAFRAEVAAHTQPLLNALRRRAPFAAMLRAHRLCLETLVVENALNAEENDDLLSFLDDLEEQTRDLMVSDATSYALLCATMLDAAAPRRPPMGEMPRVQILGVLEARLMTADRIVLGGLNEGMWPMDAPVDPWMSRTMRLTLGLPPSERRIGQMAHDVDAHAHTRHMYMTRSTMQDGKPTAASRFFLRRQMVSAQRATAPVLTWVEALRTPDARVTPLAPPMPRPPVSARPQRLSVTQVRHWRMDPYRLYAQKILRLRPLDPLDTPPDVLERGTILHDIFEEFLASIPDGETAAQATARLHATGRRVFNDFLARHDAVNAAMVDIFWWPRFENMIPWFIDKEMTCRTTRRTLHVETEGCLILSGGFQLTAKADRIESHNDGRVMIIDYKTGEPPRAITVRRGEQPQLSLEALMLLRGGFSGVASPHDPAHLDLSYWHLTGRDEGGTITSINLPIADLADRAGNGVERLVQMFADPDTAYLCCPALSREESLKHNDYAHLERLKEWRA